MRDKGLKYRSKVGAAPGTLVVHPELAQLPVIMTLMAFDATTFADYTISDPTEVIAYLGKYPVIWLNICGVGDIDILNKITTIFNLNVLAMEDVVNVHQRPKVEEYDKIYFAVSKIPEVINLQLSMQQLSMFWGENFVITFTEKATNCFTPLIARLKHGGRRANLARPEYLAYAISDTVIDSFFPLLDDYGTRLDELEERAIDNPSTWVIRHIHSFKHELNVMRRAVWSQRNAMGNFKEIVSQDKEMWFYVRDCEDHTIQLLDIVESYRDRSSGLMDIYLVSLNNRTNRVVKQLTMITTIFMPIGVLAGIYGMNFDRSQPWNMPELSWRYGYEFYWCVVIIFVTSMIYFFYRKGWFKK